MVPRSLVFGQRPLLFRMLYDLLLHVKSLSPSHRIHVTQGPIFRVSFLAIVRIFLLRCWHPEGIRIDDLQRKKRQKFQLVTGQVD